ncbi:MAG: ferredoxin-type protein NapG [Gammaproteobacteria bacterium]|nr:ferredoxin-type protein NapG [Gammaproteobacteria bacterium]
MVSERKPVSDARRRFLADTARTGCGAALLGLAVGFHARQARSTPATALRPPGALAEPGFLGACIRCGMCVRDCPYGTLRLARPEDELATGTPFFVARDVPCEMCEDIPCVKACPTGALDHALTDIDAARMGLAVLVDQENCLNFLGMRCDVCYRVCPAIDEAITLERQHNLRTGAHTMFLPVVHAEHCTGCGKCEKSCVLEQSAIKVLPLALARGAPGEHYQLGWIEKEKAGRSLVEEQGLIDLPDRVPETPGATPAVPPALQGDQL